MHISLWNRVGDQCFHAIMIVIANEWWRRVSVLSSSTARVSWLHIYTDVFSFSQQLIPGLLFWAVINNIQVKGKSRIIVESLL